jgi:hypothetical protein
MLANPGVNRSAKQRCCSVPVAYRAPAPGYAERYAAQRGFKGTLCFSEKWAGQQALGDHAALSSIR